ncbi:MAG: UDP-3-O-(3-hydroxymyristoyl)glucosamine N-acyltransferase [Planctomycetota bacterium]|nr:UDP-3-O-(3-hydroxymyristoyl)glucosamine N-acyltransferase [Planctomycetota bacterium]
MTHCAGPGAAAALAGMMRPNESKPSDVWTSGSLAEALGADLIGADDVTLRRFDTIEKADESTLTFVRDERNAARWSASRAGAALISRSVAPPEIAGNGRALLVVDDAERALALVLDVVAPPHSCPDGRHESAIVDPSARLGKNVRLGPHAVIGADCVIGDDTVLHAGVRLGAGVKIGRACDLRAGVVIEDRSVIGDRVVIHPNGVVGADGFGYRAERQDGGVTRLVKIPHAGNVEIGDDVEIGACTTIDRGKFGATVIGAGTKIDNQVQIGHNCVIGRCCVICGGVGISGSVTIGDGATIAGQAGLRDNITIGAGATIAAQSGVMCDVPPGETWLGAPAMPAKEMMKNFAALRRLPAVLRRLGLSGVESEERGA